MGLLECYSIFMLNFCTVEVIQVQQSTYLLIWDKCNLLVGKLKIFLLIHGDKWVTQLNFVENFVKEEKILGQLVSCTLH